MPMATSDVAISELDQVSEPYKQANFKDMANAIRALAMDAVEQANSGHPGMPMGMADIATVLFCEFLKFDPNHPHWPDRDRFVLSNGHGSMLLYALLYLTGYEDMTLDEIKSFRQLGAKTAGHPEYGYAAGIETTTGPLGQGLGNAVGMALAERLLAARYGELVDHYTYVFAGDGCLMEGISHETISLAGHLTLNKLIVFFDDNDISIDGSTDLTVSDDQMKRFESCGWHCQAVDGHDPDAIRAAIVAAQAADKPSMIACKTTIGLGAPTKAGKASSHGAPLGGDEIEGARKNLGWAHPPFDIPENVIEAWRDAGKRGQEAYHSWKNTLNNSAQKNDFNRAQAGEIPPGLEKALDAFKQQLSDEQPKDATRKSSGKVLEVLNDIVPELIGGSADLTGSNLTKTSALEPIAANNFSGRYIYYGVREHGMCAAMNGLALHGGLIPYGGTFFVFTDYCRPSIRLASIMHQRVIYVMTHDSIGLGEDGPTHQPVEHLASLRAMPGIQILRPADGVETAECWHVAIEAKDTPSILVLTRQGVPTVRTDHTAENLCQKGGYVLSESREEAAVTLIATGSEIHIALQAQQQLEADGISTRVVSLPCWELFNQQSDDYTSNTLGKGLKVAIEAASSFGWERYIGRDGIFIGMSGFGASAPATDLYKHFGITADNVVEQVRKKLG